MYLYFVIHFMTLPEGKMIREDTTVRPTEAQQEDLLVVHTRKYLDSLKVKISTT
jgi:hypothetical protein